MSSSDVQSQLDILSAAFTSDFAFVFGLSVIGLFLVVQFYFGLANLLDSFSRYHRNRRAANHCDDLHKGVKQGHCHYNDCTFRAGCPYFEKLTLRKRWQQFRAKKNSTPG